MIQRAAMVCCLVVPCLSLRVHTVSNLVEDAFGLKVPRGDDAGEFAEASEVWQSQLLELNGSAAAIASHAEQLQALQTTDPEFARLSGVLRDGLNSLPELEEWRRLNAAVDPALLPSLLPSLAEKVLENVRPLKSTFTHLLQLMTDQDPVAKPWYSDWNRPTFLFGALGPVIGLNMLPDGDEGLDVAIRFRPNWNIDAVTNETTNEVGLQYMWDVETRITVGYKLGGGYRLAWQIYDCAKWTRYGPVFAGPYDTQNKTIGGDDGKVDARGPSLVYFDFFLEVKFKMGFKSNSLFAFALIPALDGGLLIPLSKGKEPIYKLVEWNAFTFLPEAKWLGDLQVIPTFAWDPSTGKAKWWAMEILWFPTPGMLTFPFSQNNPKKYFANENVTSFAGIPAKWFFGPLCERFPSWKAPPCRDHGTLPGDSPFMTFLKAMKAFQYLPFIFPLPGKMPMYPGVWRPR